MMCQFIFNRYQILLSTMSLILYAPTANCRAAKAVIAAEITGVQLIEQNVDYNNLKSKEYLAKHPLGKAPLLQTPEGYIFESFTILRYVARRANALYGQSSFEEAQVESWLEQILTEFDPLSIKLLGSICGWGQLTEPVHNSIVKELKEWFKNVDAHLKDKTYLVGDSITIADIALSTYVYYVYRVFYDEKTREASPHVLRWFKQIASIPAFKSVMGTILYCEKPFPPVFATEQEQPKEQTKEKAPKAKKEQAPVETKPQQPSKNKKKKQQEEQDDQEEEVAVKKEVNPLDLLPKSPFNLDDYKREISNNPDKLAATKSLWQKFDAEGWSLWKSVYDKYEGQGVIGYSTSNLMKGFLRNLDTLRKYAFAMFGVYGTEGNYDIKGVWLLRGTEIPQDLKDHQSFEYYKFQKLDHNNEADRQVVEQYWSKIKEGDVVEGAPLFDGKYFK